MSRTTRSIKRYALLVLPVLLLVIAAAGYLYLHSRSVIPATGSQPEVVSGISNSKNQPEARTYLGGGYWLENSPQGGQVLAPEIPLHKSATSVQRMDIGAGHWLETGPQGGRIVAPQTNLNVASNSLHKTDIGAGYWLVSSPQGSQVIAPTFSTQAQPPAVTKIDIGAGYWLIIGPDGGRITSDPNR